MRCPGMAASAEPKARQLYEFGPFRVDPEKELLLREDEAVPLAPKAFQVLLVLIRHNKQVVTKDDLMKTIWPDTFVEEANLSRNIFLLRKALGESPQDHQYIVTVPGRGYRFAEDVQLVADHKVEMVAATRSRVEVQIEETRLWGWLVAGSVLLALVAAGAWKLLVHRAPVLTEKDTVVLAEFANSTGDPVFDDTLRQGLAVQLEQTPYLSVISDERIRQTLRLMGQQPDARLTPETAYQLCRRAQSSAVIDGSIARLGDEYVLGLKAVNCQTGDTLAEEQVRANGKEHVLEAMDKASANLRRKLGESARSLQTFATPLEQATTPSLEALQAYSLAHKQFFLMNYASAAILLQRAIDRDPNFALAYARLASLNNNNDQSDAALEYSAKAYALREHVTDRERLYIETNYYAFRGQTKEARQAYQLWKTIYPNDSLPDTGLGQISQKEGRFDNFLEESREAYRKDASVITSYNLVEAYADLGQLDEAAKVLAESNARYPGNEWWVRWSYVLAFLRNDPSEQKRILEAAPSGSTLQRTLLGLQFKTELYYGRHQKAVEYRQRATQLSRQLGLDEKALDYVALAALDDANCGSIAEAKRMAAEVSSQIRGKEPLQTLALAYARMGDARSAKSLADRLARLYPTDTLIKDRDLPLIHAAIAVQQNNPSLAIGLLKSAAPTELGNLDVPYTLGQAYLLLHRGPEAAAEFQKGITYRGTFPIYPPGALPYLGLARAYAVSGDTAKARAAYQDFLTLWKDADRDIPILIQARAEYAKVR